MHQTTARYGDSIGNDVMGMLEYKLGELNKDGTKTAKLLAQDLAEMVDAPQIHGPDVDLCERITGIEVTARQEPWTGAVITFNIESSLDGFFVELPKASARELYEQLGRVLGKAGADSR